MIHRLRRIGAITCVLLPLLPQAAAGGAASEEMSLLYLDPDEWERQSAERKIALEADFMRVFCTTPTMSPVSLADCLDRDRAHGALFERAIGCASALAGR